MVSERRLMQGNAGRLTAVRSKTWTRIIGLLVVVLLAGDSAFGQFLVQPMLLRRTVQPGKRVQVEMKLENLDPQASETLTLTLVELSQNPSGEWVELRAGDPNLGKLPVRSCKSWLAIPPGEIAVGAYKIVPFNLQIDVPAGTRGFYFAALVATTAPRQVTNELGVVTAMNIEMVVPVILEVQSIPMRNEVSLTGSGLEHRVETTEAAATSFATVDITNAGGTFSVVSPVVRLWGQTGGHWRKISEQKLEEIGILPGVKLHLRQNLGRPLASGPYRIETFLYVDGRRAGRIQKDLAFKGDDRMVGNASLLDVPLEVQPAILSVESVPGATRSGALQVVNTSEEGVSVMAEFVIPDQMASAVNSRGVNGGDLSCADWVTVEPRQFVMKGYSRTNLRVLAKMPKESAKHPWYYGTLILRAVYRDGQPAGTRVTYVCVQNKQVAGTPVIVPTVLTISETSPSRYLVNGGYMNGGETHVTPSCQGVLSIAGVGGGAAIYKRFLMSSEVNRQTGAMLPFEARNFTGVLDVSDVPPGTYFVTSVLKWPGGPADGLQEQRAIIVTEQGGRKFARMTELTGGPQVIKLM